MALTFRGPCTAYLDFVPDPAMPGGCWIPRSPALRVTAPLPHPPAESATRLLRGYPGERRSDLHGAMESIL